MPSPRNRLKLTGDTHLPDVGDEGTGDADVLRFEPAEGAEGGTPAKASAAPGPVGGYLQELREQVRRRPVTTLAGAFVLGMLLARG